MFASRGYSVILWGLFSVFSNLLMGGYGLYELKGSSPADMVGNSSRNWLARIEEGLWTVKPEPRHNYSKVQRLNMQIGNSL